MSQTPDILQKILVTKTEEVKTRQTKMPIATLDDIAKDVESPRGFAATLQAQVAKKKPAIIAEIKKASPSKGVIRENFQPTAIGQDYALSGASCLSVLTDRTYFQGAEVYLQQVRESCPLPVLRKDFIIDPYQIHEARALGADCILLIVAALAETQLLDLAQLTTALGMDVLIEVHNGLELERALVLTTPLIGINNRNLRTFATSLQTSLDLKAYIPAERLMITESGIHTPEDVQLMLDHEIYSFLVGEALMRATSPGAKMRELFSLPLRS